MVADEAPAIFPVVPAKPVIPTTDRAWTVTVLQELGINPQGWQKIFPVALGYVARFAHALGLFGKGIQWVGSRFS
jgi:hypothetical protein